MNGWKMELQLYDIQKEVECHSKYGKEAFKPQLVIRGKDGHLILLKGTIHQEDMRIINCPPFPPKNISKTLVLNWAINQTDNGFLQNIPAGE